MVYKVVRSVQAKVVSVFPIYSSLLYEFMTNSSSMYVFSQTSFYGKTEVVSLS